jgi:RNA polymerase sigma-70 factor (ECF subfamily)
MEDKLLVARCKRGDRDALRRIYEKYRDGLLIIGIALCHDNNIAEDALHDTFVSFTERIDQFQLTGSLKGYLATCVANRVRDILRRKESQNVSLQQEASSEMGAEASQRLISNEELNYLANMLSKLPAEQREVIVLHIYGKMRFKAIAENMCVSVNTIKGRYRYGIAKLRSIMKSEIE